MNAQTTVIRWHNEMRNGNPINSCRFYDMKSYLSRIYQYLIFTTRENLLMCFDSSNGKKVAWPRLFNSSTHDFIYDKFQIYLDHLSKYQLCQNIN